jgi:hypothetical protein
MNASSFECAPDRKTRARGVSVVALASSVVTVPAALRFHGGFVLLALPLVLFAWAALDWRSSRRAWVGSDAGRVWIDGGTAFTHDNVVAVRTGSDVQVQPAFAAGHVGVQPQHRFDLDLWTSDNTPHAPAAALARLADLQASAAVEPDVLQRLRVQLGAPSAHLVTSESPAATLAAARAIASVLRVPWLHEGIAGLDLRTGDGVSCPLADRNPIEARPIPEHLSDESHTRVRHTITERGERFEWDYSRLPAIIVCLLSGCVMLGFTLMELVRGSDLVVFAWLMIDAALGYAVFRLVRQHATYAIEVLPTEVVVSGEHTLHIARDALRDVEVRLTQYPALCLIASDRAATLPTETPFSAYWLAHAITRAAREIQATPSAGKE